ncbi:MAG: hypothetical protein V1728_03345 [Candidatus Micrarchaeota archaeon]
MTKILLDNKPVTLKKMPPNGRELMRLLKVSPQEAVLKVDGRVRPEGAALVPKNKVEVIRVVFGG